MLTKCTRSSKVPLCLAPVCLLIILAEAWQGARLFARKSPVNRTEIVLHNSSSREPNKASNQRRPVVWLAGICTTNERRADILGAAADN